MLMASYTVFSRRNDNMDVAKRSSAFINFIAFIGKLGLDTRPMFIGENYVYTSVVDYVWRMRDE
jgi:hypothetical protein